MPPYGNVTMYWIEIRSPFDPSLRGAIIDRGSPYSVLKPDSLLSLAWQGPGRREGFSLPKSPLVRGFLISPDFSRASGFIHPIIESRREGPSF